MKYRKGPYDATFAEREMIQMVYDKEITIDEMGRIWRIGIRYSNNNVYPVERKRAEHKTRDGYLEMRSMRRGTRKYVQAHRLVWQYFSGDIPKGMTINHKNGIVDDNRPSNLELMDMSSQISHSVRIGHRSFAGEKNNNSVLTGEQVAQIRMMYRGGIQQKSIALQFGISKSQISRIVRGEAWRS